jgi:hypothetical protein
MNSRRLRDGEVLVLSVLLRAAGDPWTDIDLSDLMVAEMDDGGMGSLTFLPPDPERRFGRTLVEGWFTDEDGMPVSVAVFLDRQDRLFELDVWKVDFSPLRRLPASEAEITIGLITPPTTDGADSQLRRESDV